MPIKGYKQKEEHKRKIKSRQFKYRHKLVQNLDDQQVVKLLSSFKGGNMKETKKDRLARRERLVRAIRLVHESLESHLDGCVKEKHADITGNVRFQAQCVFEYSFVINVLAQELVSLARKDYKLTHTGNGG